MTESQERKVCLLKNLTELLRRRKVGHRGSQARPLRDKAAMKEEQESRAEFKISS